MIIVFLHYVIEIYIWVIILSALLSWMRLDHALSRLIFWLTEPVLSRLRAWIGLVYQGVDFSPLLAIVILKVIDHLIMGAV